MGFRFRFLYDYVVLLVSTTSFYVVLLVAMASVGLVACSYVQQLRGVSLSVSVFSRYTFGSNGFVFTLCFWSQWLPAAGRFWRVSGFWSGPVPARDRGCEIERRG